MKVVYKSAWILFLAASFLLLPVKSVRAAGPVEILKEEISYTFGDELVFDLTVDRVENLERVDLILQTPGLPGFSGSMSISPSGNLFFSYDLEQRPLPAFSPVTYSYRFVAGDGTETTTEPKSFTYLDNRYNWQKLQEDPFIIYWYEGDLPFAREVLDAAQAGTTEVLNLLQQPESTEPVQVFVYSSQDALQTTLISTNQSWVAGHAAPELGSAVVSLPPGVDQSLEIQRQVPHEIAHIMIYRYMGAEYQYLPSWFSEGIASLMENYNRPEYNVILEKAVRERALIPLSQLCNVFPTDPDLVQLSYAESYSILSYIRQEYGVAGVQALIAAYDQGVGCDRGVEIALGKSLTQLERKWKQETFYRVRNLLIIGGLSVILLLLVAGIAWIVIRKSRKEDSQIPESLWEEE
jgi:hypothetical protein